MPTSTLTKEQLIDAAVAVIEENVTQALQDFEGDDAGIYSKAGYIEAYQVSGALQERGLLSHEHQDSQAPSWRDQARKSMEGKTKRLLDAEAARPNARILRLSSRDHQRLPCLDGRERPPYGQGVMYTTPDYFARAQAAVAARLEQERTEDETMVDLLRQASEAGLPRPIKSERYSVTYDVEGLRGLIARVAHLRNEINYLVTGEE